MQRKRLSAFTLLEMLISLSILSIVLLLASQGILMVLRMHRTQEAVTLTQTKLRLVSEVLAQEIRGAILGGLADSPYPAGSTGLSFALIDGGVGYPVTSLTNNKVKIVARNLPNSALKKDDYIMVTNREGDAFISKVSAVHGSGQYNVSFAGCNTGVSYTPNTLLFKVRSIGFNYNPITKTLNYKIAGMPQEPVAHDIANFKISYIYEKNDGSTIRQNSPIMISGIPQKIGKIAGEDVNLVRLRLDITAEAKDAADHVISRSYSSQIGLVDATVDGGKNVDNSQFVKVKGIKVCN